MITVSPVVIVLLNKNLATSRNLVLLRTFSGLVHSNLTRDAANPVLY